MFKRKGLSRIMLVLMALGLVGLACTSASSSPTPPGAEPTPTSGSNLGTPPHGTATPAPILDATSKAESPTSRTPTSHPALPDITVVDTSIASVPLDEIVFDTFAGPYVRLTDATDELILQLRDAIAPLNNPKYDGADVVGYLDPEDLVLGYSSGQEHYAYPFQMLNFHEFVNDEIDGIPILISYCPLCRSGIVFDRRLDGMTLTFGNTSALYESNAVAYDKETGSYWFQASGEAIVGPLTGKRLKPLPFVVTTWEEWKSLQTDTFVLSTD
ncbi:MAG: DUF3179 domain-containing (seleno)protein, partial [Dehalococcoidia bacterium]